MSNVCTFSIISCNTLIFTLRLKIKEFIKLIPSLLLKMFFISFLRILPKFLFSLRISPHILSLLSWFCSFIISFYLMPISFIIWKYSFTWTIIALMIVFKRLLGKAILIIIGLTFALITKSFISFSNFFKLSSCFLIWI